MWTPKRQQLFDDDPTRFLGDLRNFSTHYAIPPVTLTTRWHATGGQPMQWTNVVALNRDELVKFSRWSGASRRYVRSFPGDIEFPPVIATYSTTKAREFFGWFRNQVEDTVRFELNKQQHSVEFEQHLNETVASQPKKSPITDNELVWPVAPVEDDHRIKSLRGQWEVSVRHPPSGYAGWTIDKTKDEARQKALARLYYARDYAFIGIPLREAVTRLSLHREGR